MGTDKKSASVGANAGRFGERKAGSCPIGGGKAHSLCLSKVVLANTQWVSQWRMALDSAAAICIGTWVCAALCD